jgi:hypothetical protein
MSARAVAETGCGVFAGLRGADLAPDALYRFVVGEDAAPRPLDAAAIRAELGDPFALAVLAGGVFPHNGIATLDALITGGRASGQFVVIRKPAFFLLGEGSQIAMDPETADVDRNIRFVVAVGGGADGPDVLISVFQPESGPVELMAWDRAAGGFNFYRTVAGGSAWVFAGNSRHAVAEPTEGKGPFESHTGGNFLMKELRRPWQNWHSQMAPVDEAVFAAGDPRRAHPWFTGRVPQGAYACELEVARPSIERWTKARFAAWLAAGPELARPARVLRHVLDTPTVNLTSSTTTARPEIGPDVVDLPGTFFVDSGALADQLGLQAPPPFEVAWSLYETSLTTFGVKLSDGGGFEREGDTHFAFFVPERAFEDERVLQEAIAVGLLSERLAASLLMVDFANPVFSERRAALLAHVPATATISDAFSAQLADAIVAAAAATPEGSPQREFAGLWAAGDGWRAAFDALLGAYYAAVAAALTRQEGFDAYVRLAESRRDRVRRLPIFESPLLFARTNIPRGRRFMRADGTVADG